MFEANDALVERLAWVEAHEAAEKSPFWDVVQASDRAALFYGQLRRADVPRLRARLLAVLQFTHELLAHDELSGVRLTRDGYLGKLVELAR